MKNKSLISLTFIIIFLFSSAFTVVGHRGDPTKFPEETIQSDNSAFNSGADYVELDLHLSKDGIPVVSHDDDLSRMVTTKAIVSQNNFQTLHQMTYANGEHILSLSELFAHYQKRTRTKFILETKVDHTTDSSYLLESKITALVKQYHMQNRIMIHSFSGASLRYFRKSLPQCKLMLIVGSLGRIDFSILRIVNAVNISEDIIYQHPWVIHWLHTLGIKVFVWAEMDESPSMWEWLINKNIDGVITNFPALGFKYKLAKENTKKFTINANATYLGTTKAITYKSPYSKDKQNKLIKPFSKLKLSYGVVIDGQLFYQIGKQEFIPADLVSLSLTPQDIKPFEGLKIITRPDYRVPLYNHPNDQAKTNNFLKQNYPYSILNFNGGPKNLWLQTKAGWVKQKEVLFYGLFNPKSDNFKTYQNQAHGQTRYPEVALLPNLITYSVPHPEFLKMTSRTRAICQNQFI